MVFLFLGINVFNAVAQISLHVETPGTLSQMIAENRKHQIKELTLTGKINSVDICFIREMCGANVNNYETKGQLEKLNLEGVEIISGGQYFLRVEKIDRFITDGNTIPPYLFMKCKQLKELILPSNIFTIDSKAFAWTELTSITIPPSVTKFGDNVFSPGLKEMKISNATPPAISNKTFLSADQGTVFDQKECTLHVPKGSRDAYWLTWGFDNIVEEE